MIDLNNKPQLLLFAGLGLIIVGLIAFLLTSQKQPAPAPQQPSTTTQPAPPQPGQPQTQPTQDLTWQGMTVVLNGPYTVGSQPATTKTLGGETKNNYWLVEIHDAFIQQRQRQQQRIMPPSLILRTPTKPPPPIGANIIFPLAQKFTTLEVKLNQAAFTDELSKFSYGTKVSFFVDDIEKEVVDITKSHLLYTDKVFTLDVTGATQLTILIKAHGWGDETNDGDQTGPFFPILLDITPFKVNV